jgi:hypothetical protein
LIRQNRERQFSGDWSRIRRTFLCEWSFLLRILTTKPLAHQHCWRAFLLPESFI